MQDWSTWVQKKRRTCGAVAAVPSAAAAASGFVDGVVGDEGERGRAGCGWAKAGMRLRRVRVMEAQERESCMRRACVAKRTRVERVGLFVRITVRMEREGAGGGISVEWWGRRG